MNYHKWIFLALFVLFICNTHSNEKIKTNDTARIIPRGIDELSNLTKSNHITVETHHIWVQFIKNTPSSVKVLEVPDGIDSLEIENGIKHTLPIQKKEINEKNVKKFISDYLKIDWREFR